MGVGGDLRARVGGDLSGCDLSGGDREGGDLSGGGKEATFVRIA